MDARGLMAFPGADLEMKLQHCSGWHRSQRWFPKSLTAEARAGFPLALVLPGLRCFPRADYCRPRHYFDSRSYRGPSLHCHRRPSHRYNRRQNIQTPSRFPRNRFAIGLPGPYRLPQLSKILGGRRPASHLARKRHR
jgi:hypothetical protein